MTVELLFFAGCPNHDRLLPRVRELAAAAGAELVLRPVETPEEAQAERFLGSPTVRVDGRDIEPGADERTDYGLKCRIYATTDGLHGMPPEKWIRDALAAQDLT